MPVYCCYSYKNWSFTNPEMFKSALVYMCLQVFRAYIACALVYNNTDYTNYIKSLFMSMLSRESDLTCYIDTKSNDKV